MSDIPASGYMADEDRSQSEFRVAIESFRDAVTEMPGGAEVSTLEISGDTITPTAAAHIVDSEGLTGNDDLTHAALTNHPEGRQLTLLSANSARNITVKNASGGDGQFLMSDSADFVLDETNQSITFIRIGDNWVELLRSYGNVKSAFRTYLGLGTAAVVNTGTGGANVPTITQADARYAALAGLASQTFEVGTATTATQAVRKSQLDAALPAAGFCQGRLTLATGVPFTITDQLAKTTLYFTPFDGNKIGLYDGSSTWTLISFTELSIAVPATTNTMYDVFIYNNAGTATFELTQWTDDQNRATALTTVDGVLVKTGATTRRFVGCLRTTGASGETEVSTKRKFVANYYNRKAAFLKATDPVNTWTTSTATFHAANGNTTVGEGRFEFIIPVADQLVECTHAAKAGNSNGSVGPAAGIGLDSTTVNSAQLIGSATPDNLGRGLYFASHYKGYPAVGYHYIQALVAAPGSVTHTFSGDGNSTTEQTGLLASIAA